MSARIPVTPDTAVGVGWSICRLDWQHTRASITRDGSVTLEAPVAGNANVWCEVRPANGITPTYAELDAEDGWCWVVDEQSGGSR